MRRLLSFVLLLVFGLPVVAPALGPEASAETNLPACCRRDGMHHCTKTPEQLEALRHGNQLNAVSGKCPCCPATPANLHQDVLALVVRAAMPSGIVTQTEKVSQAETWARIALAGARHKRGPPQDLLKSNLG